MATYGDITLAQMAFLIELVERSQPAAAQPSEDSGMLEWLLVLCPEHGTLLRAGVSWTDLPAEPAFYQSLAQRGYLGVLSSDDIISGELVIWPTERAIALAAWATTHVDRDTSSLE